MSVNGAYDEHRVMNVTHTTRCPTLNKNTFYPKLFEIYARKNKIKNKR